ncbi:MAG: glycosyltransferase [Balneolaceae bacterium]
MTFKKRNILIVSPSLNVGGIGRHLSVFAESFNNMGHEVKMLSCLNEKKFYKVSDDIEVHRFPHKRKRGIIGKISFYPLLISYIRKKIRDIRPDFILVFGDLFNPLVLLSALGTNIPVFIGDMTSPDYDYGKLHRILKKVLYPQSAGIVCQTKFAETYKKKEFGNKINTIVLDNPIREVQEHDVDKENIILYVGRFAREKAPDRLIKAFSLMEDKQGWKLVMAGDGPMLEEMKALAASLGVKEETSFLGKVKNLDKLYAKASIYVLPSVLEGFPNALCEAMIAGLPVVCFDGFPSDEIINNGHDGIIIKNGDIEELSLQLKRLMNDEELRQKLGNNAKEIRSRLDKEKITRTLLSFMEK